MATDGMNAYDGWMAGAMCIIKVLVYLILDCEIYVHKSGRVPNWLSTKPVPLKTRPPIGFSPN